MSITLALDEQQLNHYRKIANRKLLEGQISVNVSIEHSEVPCFKVSLWDAVTGTSHQFDVEFESSNEAHDFVNNDYLPNMGLQIQIDRLKVFHMLL